jgi:bifunctional non-homologous end joining protein LigD
VTPGREYRPLRPFSGAASGHPGTDGEAVSFGRDDNALVTIEGRQLKLSNLRKIFWPASGITKGDLVKYYAAVSGVLLPHLKDRAMVMKRYPQGSEGPFFFQKRAPIPRPEWIEICSIEHASGNVIDFPIIRDLPSLLWVANLGCIDLNPWYARCDDVDRPDYVHFDLDPVAPADFKAILEAAMIVHEALDALNMPNMAKTTGSRGIHIYVPIERGPTQKEVWSFAKEMARSLEALYPRVLTAQYRIGERPVGRVLVDYNQNAWGRTLASVYSVRPKAGAPVSAPVTWAEAEKGIRLEDFNMDNMADRIGRVGDLWTDLLSPSHRFDLAPLIPQKKRGPVTR